MSDAALRSGLIRLAHAKPELRKHLLPLLTKEAALTIPGVHLVEDLSAIENGILLVFRERGGDLLGNEENPGYYLDYKGILKRLVAAEKMSPAGELKAKKALSKLMSRLASNNTASSFDDEAEDTQPYGWASLIERVVLDRGVIPGLPNVQYEIQKMNSGEKEEIRIGNDYTYSMLGLLRHHDGIQFWGMDRDRKRFNKLKDFKGKDAQAVVKEALKVMKRIGL